MDRHAPDWEIQVISFSHDLSDCFKDGHVTQVGSVGQDHRFCCNYKEKDLVLLGLWGEVNMKESRDERSTEWDQVMSSYKHLDPAVPEDLTDGF